VPDTRDDGSDYATRLGIPRPRIEDLVGRPGVKLFHLMVVALIERSGPMRLDEIARRLEEAGLARPHPDLERSLLKAWHGLPPVHRDPAGRFSLDLWSDDLDLLLFMIGLRPPHVAPSPEPPRVEPVHVPDDVSLSLDEVECAFADRYLAGVTPLRQAAAVLDASSRAMKVIEVETFLARLTPHRVPVTLEGARYWRSRLVRVDAGGRLVLDRQAPGVAEMRRAIRALGRRAAQERAREAESSRLRAEYDARHAAEIELERAHAAIARRAILHAVPSPSTPAVVGLLDVATRAIETFTTRDLAALARRLGDYQVLAALQARDLLHALGVDPNRWHVSDLGPPQKTLRLDRRGRTLKITAPMLITGTTGIRRPLGDVTTMRAFLAAGDHARVRRQLERDLRSLHAFHRYGVLHRRVRLRWGFLDEGLPVAWALPGDTFIYEIVSDAIRLGHQLEIVVGAAPGWNDAWARARRVDVLQLHGTQLIVRDSGLAVMLDLLDVQAARPADDRR
jgi:hypothetical protein